MISSRKSLVLIFSLACGLSAPLAQARVIRNASAKVSADVSYQWVDASSPGSGGYDGPRYVEHANLTVYNNTKLSPSYIQCSAKISAYGEVKQGKEALTPGVGFRESDDAPSRPSEVAVVAQTPIIAPNSGVQQRVFVKKWIDYGGAHKMKVSELNCRSVHLMDYLKQESQKQAEQEQLKTNGGHTPSLNEGQAPKKTLIEVFEREKFPNLFEKPSVVRQRGIE